LEVELLEAVGEGLSSELFLFVSDEWGAGGDVLDAVFGEVHELDDLVPARPVGLVVYKRRLP
jgi:hypothetical protein